MKSNVGEDHRKEDRLDSPVGHIVDILAEDAVFLEFPRSVDR